jgi:hypothetical protein
MLKPLSKRLCGNRKMLLGFFIEFAVIESVESSGNALERFL